MSDSERQLARRGRRAKVFLLCILIINGVLTLFALPAVFMPMSWMDAVHQRMGLGPLPEGPIVEYLARSLSGMYAAFGSMTLVLAWDIRRFAPLVTWWGVMAILFGVALLWIDLHAGMPDWWTWGEGPYLIPVGVLVLLLHGMVRRAFAAPA